MQLHYERDICKHSCQVYASKLRHHTCEQLSFIWANNSCTAAELEMFVWNAWWLSPETMRFWHYTELNTRSTCKQPLDTHHVVPYDQNEHIPLTSCMHFSAVFRFTSTRASLAPSRANAWQTALPIPLPAPKDKNLTNSPSKQHTHVANQFRHDNGLNETFNSSNLWRCFRKSWICNETVV